MNWLPVSRRTVLFLAVAHFGTMVDAMAVWSRIVLAADPAGGPNVDPPGKRKAAANADFTSVVRVRFNDEVLPLAEIIRRSSSDRRQILYRQLRITRSASAEGQVELALWCRKQGLADEERLHWWIALSMEPNHAEAIKALRLRKYRGALLSAEDIEQLKKAQKQAERASKEWRPKLKRIRRSIEQGDADEREAALRELQAIQDPLAIPSLKEVFSFEDAEFGLQLVELLEKIAEPESAAALAQIAIQSADPYVRERAAAALRPRPYHTYVPVLAARLAAPIELSVDVTASPGGPVFERYEGYEYTGRLVVGLYDKVRLRSEYRPSDVLIWTPETRPFSGLLLSDYRPDRLRYDFVLSRDSPDPETPYEYAGTIEEDHGSSTNSRKVVSIQDLERQVKEANAATARLNERIHAALAESTKANVISNGSAAGSGGTGVRPQVWWDWWRKQCHVNNYFAQGVEVWTLTGLVPIEQILVGDRVLARDPKSRELTFKLVIGRDVQPNSEMRVFEVDSRTIVATPEQPLFVTGEGWRKASELKVGMQLDGLGGARRIEKVGSGDALATYGLVVMDVPTFFVDRHGVLVHDATRR
jgi:hypothetical protein